MVSLHVECSRAKSMPHYNDIHKMELLRLPVLKTLYRDQKRKTKQQLQVLTYTRVAL